MSRTPIPATTPRPTFVVAWLSGLHADWPDVTTVDVYTVRPPLRDFPIGS